MTNELNDDVPNASVDKSGWNIETNHPLAMSLFLYEIFEGLPHHMSWPLKYEMNKKQPIDIIC